MHADVEGSTALTTELGDEAGRRELETTKRIVREQSEAHGGREIDSVGDAMMLTFTSTRGAIAGAIAVQNVLTARELASTSRTLRVRVGLNVGEVMERDGQPFGAAVNAGARVMAKADGGQILVSEMVRRLAGTVPGVTYRDRGRHVFKGFDERWRLYELDWADRAPLPSRATRRLGTWRYVVAAAAIALVAAAAVVWLVSRPPGGLPGVAPNHVGLIDPESAKIVEQVDVGVRPTAIAAAGGTLWVASLEGRSVVRIDEDTGERTSIPVPGHPSALLADARGVWVAATIERRLIRIDRAFDRAGAIRPVEATSLARAGGYLWAARDGTTLQRLDRSGRRAGRDLLLDDGADSVVGSRGVVWVDGRSGLTPVGARTAIPGPLVRLLGTPVALAAAAASVWTVVRRPGGESVVQKVDTETGASAGSAPVGDDPGTIVADGGSVWVANRSDGTVSRFRASDLTPLGLIEIGATPAGLATGTRGVWVAGA